MKRDWLTEKKRALSCLHLLSVLWQEPLALWRLVAPFLRDTALGVWWWVADSCPHLASAWPTSMGHLSMQHICDLPALFVWSCSSSMFYTPTWSQWWRKSSSEVASLSWMLVKVCTPQHHHVRGFNNFIGEAKLQTCQTEFYIPNP